MLWLHYFGPNLNLSHAILPSYPIFDGLLRTKIRYELEKPRYELGNEQEVADLYAIRDEGP